MPAALNVRPWHAPGLLWRDCGSHSSEGATGRVRAFVSSLAERVVLSAALLPSRFGEWIQIAE